MRRLLACAGVVAVLVGSIGVSGCSTGASARARISLNQAGVTVQEVSVRIRALPGYEEFTSAFASSTRDLLRARGLRVEGVVVSSAENSRQQEADAFRYHLDCTPTPDERNSLTVTTPGGGTIAGIPGAVLKVTVSCKLADVESNSNILQAEVTAIKGWGPGFGLNEAQTAARRLVEDMAASGVLIGPS